MGRRNALKELIDILCSLIFDPGRKARLQILSKGKDT